MNRDRLPAGAAKLSDPSFAGAGLVNERVEGFVSAREPIRSSRGPPRNLYARAKARFIVRLDRLSLERLARAVTAGQTGAPDAETPRVGLLDLSVLGSLQPSSPATTLPDLGRSRLEAITVTDPQDVEQYDTADCPLDIRSVSLRTYTGGTGRRMLAVTVGAYELYDSLVEIANIKLRFDASGGPRS